MIDKIWYYNLGSGEMTVLKKWSKTTVNDDYW